MRLVPRWKKVSFREAASHSCVRFRLLKSLRSTTTSRSESILRSALEEPLRLMPSNAGHEGAVVVGNVRDSKEPNFGFNAATEDYADMTEVSMRTKINLRVCAWISIEWKKRLQHGKTKAGHRI